MVSFFTEKNFLGSIVRGRQIADWIGGKYNPKKREGICVFIKPRSLERVLDGDFVDVSDGEWVGGLLEERPDINVIVHSLHSFDLLKRRLRNKIVYIHQQHLNWERETKKIKEFKVGGYIGSPSLIASMIYKETGEKLKKAGFDFKTCFDYQTREDAVDFYKSIDFLVVTAFELGDPGHYKTATKLINAASFGIPSLAYPSYGYKEFEGFYTPIKDYAEMIEAAKNIKFDSEKLIKKADEYHISKVAQRYNTLLHLK